MKGTTVLLRGSAIQTFDPSVPVDPAFIELTARHAARQSSVYTYHAHAIVDLPVVEIWTVLLRMGWPKGFTQWNPVPDPYCAGTAIYSDQQKHKKGFICECEEFKVFSFAKGADGWIEKFILTPQSEQSCAVNYSIIEQDEKRLLRMITRRNSFLQKLCEGNLESYCGAFKSGF